MPSEKSYVFIDELGDFEAFAASAFALLDAHRRSKRQGRDEAQTRGSAPPETARSIGAVADVVNPAVPGVVRNT